MKAQLTQLGLLNTNVQTFAQLLSAYGVQQGVVMTATAARVASTGIPGFAAGGDHMGGLRIVGEREPELEVTGPARIYNGRQMRDLLRGDDDGVVAELRALRAQLDDHQRALEAIATLQVNGNGHLRDMRINGVQVRNTNTGETLTVVTA
jgi:hypothetical protein